MSGWGVWLGFKVGPVSVFVSGFRAGARYWVRGLGVCLSSGLGFVQESGGIMPMSAPEAGQSPETVQNGLQSIFCLALSSQKGSGNILG